jgi:hypothetical protein
MWTRGFSQTLAVLASVAFGLLVEAGEPAPVEIGSRRELFVDELLIGELQGTRLKLHEPQRLPRNAYPARPTGHYATVIQDGDLYRLYYRGDKIPGAHWRDGWTRYHDQEVTLYAESRDGYRWTKPDLKLYRLAEFPDGNVALDEGLAPTVRSTRKTSPSGRPPSNSTPAITVSWPTGYDPLPAPPVRIFCTGPIPS